MRTTLTIGICAALLAAASAQAPSVTGVWSVTTEGAQGSTDGGSWNLAAMSGSLTLEQKSTAVTGSWKGQMPNAWTVTGELNDQTLELRTEWRDVPATRNGEKSTAKARWVFRGTLSGETLKGTMALQTEDGSERPQPFSATRTP